jgi:hypothetical protein
VGLPQDANSVLRFEDGMWMFPLTFYLCLLFRAELWDKGILGSGPGVLIEDIGAFRGVAGPTSCLESEMRRLHVDF